MADHTPRSEADNSILFKALRSAGADEMLTFDAVEETRKMAGDNHSAAIDIMKAEIHGDLRVLHTRIDNIKWTILAVASVSTVILAAVSIAVSFLPKS